MAVSPTVLKKWIFIGAGQTHLLALRNLSKKLPQDIEIVFVCDQLKTPIVDMFPAFVAGLYRQDEFYVSFENLLTAVHGRLIHASVKCIDQKSKKLQLSDGTEIEFDLLSVDSDPFISTEQYPGATTHAHLLLPIDDFQKSILSFCQSLRGKRKVDLVFIGTGLLSIECAFGLRQRLKIYGADVFVHIIEIESEEDVKLFDGSRVDVEIRKHAQTLGFKFHTKAKLKEILATEIVLHDGTRIKSDFTSIAHTLRAPLFLAKSDLDLHNGFVSINHFLQSSNPHIFCVGNTSKDSGKKWLVSKRQIRKQAKVLSTNLRALSLQAKLKKYRPNKSDLHILIDGQGGAFAFKGSLFFKPAHFLWELKDWLDQKFLSSFKMPDSKSEKKTESGSNDKVSKEQHA